MKLTSQGAIREEKTRKAQIKKLVIEETERNKNEQYIKKWDVFRSKRDM